jgi:anti-sigma factor (TIGR02949 family)
MADMACQELVELVTDYLEGALSPELAARLERHLDLCDGCERYLDQMRATVAAVGRIETTDVPDDLRDRLLTAFRERRGP